MTSEHQQGRPSPRRRALKATFNPFAVLGIGISLIYTVKTYNDLAALHAPFWAWAATVVGPIPLTVVLWLAYRRNYRTFVEQDHIRERLIRGAHPDKLDD